MYEDGGSCIRRTRRAESIRQVYDDVTISKNIITKKRLSPTFSPSDDAPHTIFIPCDGNTGSRDANKRAYKAVRAAPS